MQYHSARAIVSINTTSIASKAFHTVQKDKYLSDFDVSIALIGMASPLRQCRLIETATIVPEKAPS